MISITMNKTFYLIFLISAILLTSCGRKAVTDQVNLFIGTGGHGHTFPGATVPFGMVQLSPDTRMTGWDGCSGYHHSDTTIIGFSHTHLSGTGIGDYGDILIMPTVGKQNLTRGDEAMPGSGYRSGFSRDTEKARPGYYTVKLNDSGVTAELTATARAGFHRYTFPESKESGFILDLDHTLQNHRNIRLEIKVLNNTDIQGLKVTRGWARRHYVYFFARFSRPFTYRLAVNDTVRDSLDETDGRNLKALLQFSTGKNEEVLVKVGISAVDYEGARNNLETEIPGWDFDRTVKDADNLWYKELSKVIIEGGTGDQRTIFYTALYHSMISPNISSDSDGRYRGIDLKNHDSDGSPDYTVFSLWDTFRAAHPLFTILNPGRDAEMIRSLIRKYHQGGILPMWELASNYTGTMIGYHAVPVIADAYMKGIRDFNVDEAYEAMKRSSHFDTAGLGVSARDALSSLVDKAKLYNDSIGFIPYDKVNQSVAKALEYSYNDWCISQMAMEMGKEEDFIEYSERATRYRKYFDRSTGFMRGISSAGEWRVPFNPRFSDHTADDYVEGNAWQWSWFVPHDVRGLVDLMGGRDAFITKLDSLFSVESKLEGQNVSADISGMIGQYAHGNEPSHQIVHFYNYVDQPWKTQELVDSILNSLYFNNPDGLSGNEDCGQMSAWYVLNSLGFYSVAPGEPVYSLGRPIFDKATVRLENGKNFIIETKNNSLKNKYVQSVKLNGKVLSDPFFNHDDIISGGSMVIMMGSSPNTGR